VEPALVLRHDLRLKARAAVTRLLDPDRPMLGMDRLCGRAVSRIADTTGRRLPVHIAEMLGQLHVHRPLHQPLRQLAQHAIRPGDLLRRARTSQQLIDQLIRQLRRLPVDPHPRDRHIMNLVWQGRPSFPAGLSAELPLGSADSHNT
jgi:hypothetical protein